MKSRTVLITGTSSGFGKDLVHKFIKNGDIVIASLRNAKERQNIFSNIDSTKLHILDLDVTNKDDISNAKKFIENKFSGQLDILINNAGYGHYGSLEESSIEQIENIFKVNVIGPSVLIKEFLPMLRRSTEGKIFNVSSLLGLQSMPLSSLYSASKFALEGLNQGLQFELSTQGIQSCNICPGGHRTSFQQNIIWSKHKNSIENYRNHYTFLENIMDKLQSKKATPLTNVTGEILRLSKKKKVPMRILVGKDAKTFNGIGSLLPKNLFYSFMTSFYRKKVES